MHWLSGGDAGAPRQPFALSVGNLFSTRVTPMREQGRRLCPSKPPHLGIILLVVESSTRRRWPEHNAPAAGFSTSIAQSSGRTGRGLALNLNETENALFPRRIFFSIYENSSIHPSIHPSLVASCFLKIVRWQRSRAARCIRCDKYIQLECASM